MKFRILLHKRADKFLRELKPEEKKRLVDKFKQLENFPAVRLDIVKIAGEENTFRLRVGNYRALFKVFLFLFWTLEKEFTVDLLMGLTEIHSTAKRKILPLASYS
jgi:mRNA interferase RelE/StbE